MMFKDGLYRYGLFSGILAFAGLPLYILAPEFFTDKYGVSFTAIGLTLLALRLVDFVQDPLLGRWLDRVNSGHKIIALLAGTVMALAMFGLFGVTAPIAPLAWFALTMIFLFSAYSLLTIMFYAQGLNKAQQIDGAGHIRVASWREAGALIGVCLASILPFVLMKMGVAQPMTIFAGIFAGSVAIAVFAMRKEWTRPALASMPLSDLLGDPTLRRLLLIGLINAAPVAVTSNLFVFFVEYRLGAANSAGPLLLMFFVAAAISVPLWGILARGVGVPKAIQWGMLLAILTFAYALTLGSGDMIPFAIVCILSGAALGADMSLLPAAFSSRLDGLGTIGGQAFGLWNFCAKFALAIAAGLTLPTLDLIGLSRVAENSEQTLWMLTLLYAGLPCALKLIALALVSSPSFQKESV